ncbi:ribonuclease YeeF family protein [Sporolactobacillus laevolacticus]|uniref:ribonuclease YeeF family protein n=1 Tax=Sporolactobacillus laevolacticus TaxID=33018 RepID=UPI0025B2B36F|nr:LXG domain-containing protein [Sporolactobacillus laevolacticus]MDN3954537.1 LXG domain-containing protein [Sporolactobacillus laevolacticus]
MRINSGGAGSAGDTKTYDSESLISAANAHAKQYETLRSQFHTLRTAFIQIANIGSDFQGQGAEAIKSFYSAQVNVVDAWLRMIDKKIAYYHGVAGTIDNKKLGGNTQVQVPFLNEDLSRGYARSKEMIREHRDDISKILSSISDLVPINVFSNHEVDQALDTAEEKRAKMVLDVQDLDQNLTNEYQQVNEDLPYIASLYGELINATRQGADVQPMHFNAHAYHDSKIYQVQDEMTKETQKYLKIKKQQEKAREVEKTSEKDPIESLASAIEGKVADTVDQVVDEVKKETAQAGRTVGEIKDEAEKMANSSAVQGVVHFTVGAADQVIENNTGLKIGHQDEWDQFKAYKSGEIAGDVFSAFEGVAEIIGGGGIIAGGTTVSVAGAPVTVGASLAVEPGVLAVGTAGIVHGGMVTANGFSNYAKDVKDLKQDMSVERTGGGAKALGKSNPEKVVNQLSNYESRKWIFGNEEFLLDKSGIKHILVRHHPEYWNGSVKSSQTFLDKDMTLNDITNTIGEVLKQNREKLIEKGSVGMYQVEGTVNGVNYVVGLNKGRVGQFYKK